MDISIIISGNLTGFSRFYASPNANDIYNEAKFDFDYRNFLTFINAGDKAYAISFSPKVIAVSLITRILDSFRRPGILVVTALVPRYQLVSGTLNAQDKSAIYRLLNEINDKFYEKNFLNGMVNQNPAVLMQDYYSDILRNYVLVGDRMQKAINTTIEVNSPNKRIGYVSTSEKDMPKYLSSLMRKSYNGYHHIFFADKAPTNIDEPAEEIVTYRARVENGNRNVPGEVSLTDKIPTVAPEQGERPLSNTNFTYGQVLNGETGPDIIATIENDTIVLTFRFPKEEKTVYFKFFDGANELPIHVLRPILVESNGISMPISTDSFTFYGKEIYGLKTIKSSNPEYTVESSSSNVDLQRFNNGATINVYVSKGWTWTFDPMINNRRVNIKPISITLVNKYTGEKKYIARVTGYVTERLSGSAQEWEMQIESDYYKSATFPATGPYRLEPKPQPTPVAHGGGNGGQGGNVQRNGEGTRSQGQSSSNQGLKFTNGQNNEAKESARLKEEQKKRYIKIGVYALVMALLCFVGGCWAYTKWNPSNPEDHISDTPITAEERSMSKNVKFVILDKTNDNLSSNILNQLSLSFEPNDNVLETEDKFTRQFVYTNDPAENHNVRVSIFFEDISISEPMEFNVKTMSDNVTINLDIKESDISEYLNLPSKINSAKNRELNLRIAQIGNNAFKNKFENKLNNVVIEDTQVIPTVNWERLDRVDASLSIIAEVQEEALQKNVPIPQKYKDRIENLDRVIQELRTGKKPNVKGLSDAQIAKINSIWKVGKSDERDPNEFAIKGIKRKTSSIQSISEFESILKNLGKLK